MKYKVEIVKVFQISKNSQAWSVIGSYSPVFLHRGPSLTPASSCGICGGRFGTVTGYSLNTAVFPCQSFHQISILIFHSSWQLTALWNYRWLWIKSSAPRSLSTAPD